MAYNTENLVKLNALRELATRAKADINATNERVKKLEDVGAQANVIEQIKVNGAVQAVTNKAVDIAIPGYTIEKATSSGDYAAVYQLKKDGTAVGAAINIPKDMVVQEGSVVENPEGQAAGTYIKLVLQNATEPLYINVGDLIEYVTSGSAAGDMVVIAIDETTHKVTASITDGTITKAKLAEALVTELEGKVDKVTGKGLSTNDYTTAEKTKLAGIAEGANNYTHPAHTAHASGLYKVTVDASGHVTAADEVVKADITGLGIPAQDTTYPLATGTADGLMAKGDKSKLDGIAANATKVEASANAGYIKVNGTETCVVPIATDAEVTEMLDEVFPAKA